MSNGRIRDKKAKENLSGGILIYQFRSKEILGGFLEIRFQIDLVSVNNHYQIGKIQVKYNVLHPFRIE